jgi:hypothetical protein
VEFPPFSVSLSAAQFDDNVRLYLFISTRPLLPFPGLRDQSYDRYLLTLITQPE